MTCAIQTELQAEGPLAPSCSIDPATCFVGLLNHSWPFPSFVPCTWGQEAKKSLPKFLLPCTLEDSLSPATNGFGKLPGPFQILYIQEATVPTVLLVCMVAMLSSERDNVQVLCAYIASVRATQTLFLRTHTCIY